MWGSRSNKAGKEKPFETEAEATDPSIGEQDKKTLSRRRFFKRAAVGAVALTGTAELAKQAASSIPDPDPQHLYEKDIQAGDAAIAEWEYVVMSKEEKQDMVQALIDNHKKTI